MDIMDYDEYLTLKQFLDAYENGTAEEWIKRVEEEEKQKNAYKNRWQTAIRDLILGR